MALLVVDHEGNSPKVWQPWYINVESEESHKDIPSRVHREQRIRNKSPLYHQNKYQNMDNLRNMESASKRVYGDPEYIDNFPKYSYPLTNDDDLPLDMSMKRRSPPAQEAPINTDDRLSQQSPTSSNAFSQQTQNFHERSPLVQQTQANYRINYDRSESRERPSVITCASTRFLQNYSDSAEKIHSNLPPPSYRLATAHLRNNSSLSEAEATMLNLEKVSSYPNMYFRPVEPMTDDRNSSKYSAKRQHVQANEVDPEIDEHFRRSLGTHYQQLFANPSPEKDSDYNDSVDDHFAKALGDTWRKLKSNKVEHSEGNSPKGRNAFMNPASQSVESTADVSITRISMPSKTGQNS